MDWVIGHWSPDWLFELQPPGQLFRLAQKKARLLINNQLNWLANEGLDWQIDIDHLVNI